jgi:hypothetical protein
LIRWRVNISLRFAALLPNIFQSLELIAEYADSYARSREVAGKWKITMEIVKAVLAKGRFIKPSKEHGWVIVELEAARQKVAHALQYHKRRRQKQLKLQALEGYYAEEANIPVADEENGDRAPKCLSPGTIKHQYDPVIPVVSPGGELPNAPRPSDVHIPGVFRCFSSSPTGSVETRTLCHDHVYPEQNGELITPSQRTPYAGMVPMPSVDRSAFYPVSPHDELTWCRCCLSPCMRMSSEHAAMASVSRNEWGVTFPRQGEQFVRALYSASDHHDSILHFYSHSHGVLADGCTGMRPTPATEKTAPRFYPIESERASPAPETPNNSYSMVSVDLLDAIRDECQLEQRSQVRRLSFGRTPPPLDEQFVSDYHGERPNDNDLYIW